MRSKKSFFSGTLLRQGLLRQYWPLWALYTLLTSLALCVPAAVLFSGIREEFTSMTMENVVYSMQQMIYLLVPYAALLAGMLAAYICFGYLFKVREAQFFFALPLNRTALFWTRFLTGLAALLLPLLIAWGILVCVAAFYGYAGIIAAQLFAWLGIAVSAHLFFYALAVCVANLTGHGAAYAVLYFVANFFFWYFGSVVNNILSIYLHGFPDHNHMRVFWRPLSPFAYMLSYEGQTNPALYPGVAVAGAALSALAYLLHRNRRAETAGDVTSFRVLRPLLVYGFAVCFGIMAGYIMASIAMAATGYRNGANEPAFMSVFFLIFTVVGYFLARLLAHKSARAMRVHWKGALPLLAAALLCAGCLHFDWVGYQARVPDEEDIAFVVCAPDYPYMNDPWNARQAAVGDIQSGYLQAMAGVPSGGFDPLTGDLAVDARAYAPGLFERPENIRLAISLHEAMIQDRQNTWSDGGNGKGVYTSYSINVIYQLKDGSSVRRQYRLFLNSADALAGGSRAAQIERMEALYNTAEFREKNFLYPGADANTARRAAIRNMFSGFDGKGVYDTAHMVTGADDTRGLMDAVMSDLREGNLGRFFAVATAEFTHLATPVVVEIDYDHPLLYPEAYYAYLPEEIQKSSRGAGLRVPLTRNAAHTLQWMAEHGVDLDSMIGSGGNPGMDSEYGTGIDSLFNQYSHNPAKSGVGDYYAPGTAMPAAVAEW